MRIMMFSFFLLIIADYASPHELGEGPVPDPLPPVGPRVYPCFQFPNGCLPVIDGDLSDWEIVGSEYVQDTYMLVEYNWHLGRRYNPHDCDVRIRTGYNLSTNRIYVAVEYYDDFHNFDRTTTSDDPGLDDIFELVVDADNSGQDFIFNPDRSHLRSTHAQNYHIYFHGRDSTHVWVWGDQHWLGEMPYSKFASRYDGAHRSAGVSTLEFWVTPFNYADPAGPEYSAVAHMAEGDTLGLGYAILDWDADEGHGAKFWALADTVLIYRNADFLPDFVLAPLKKDMGK